MTSHFPTISTAGSSRDFRFVSDHGFDSAPRFRPRPRKKSNYLTCTIEASIYYYINYRFDFYPEISLEEGYGKSILNIDITATTNKTLQFVNFL